MHRGLLLLISRNSMRSIDRRAAFPGEALAREDREKEVEEGNTHTLTHIHTVVGERKTVSSGDREENDRPASPGTLRINRVPSGLSVHQSTPASADCSGAERIVVARLSIVATPLFIRLFHGLFRPVPSSNSEIIKSQNFPGVDVQLKYRRSEENSITRLDTYRCTLPRPGPGNSRWK